jgi:hypothetical protein
MGAQQGSTIGQPAPTPATLRAQIDAAQVSLNDALARRAGIVARIDAAGGPGERVRLRNGELRGVDGEITRIKQELAGLQAELQQREALAANPAPVVAPPASPIVAPDVAPTVPSAGSTTVPPVAPLDLNSAMLGGIATVVVLVPLLLAIAWRAGRRAALAGRRTDSDDDRARLTRMEDAIAAVTLEVERVSESQRFLTNALVGDGVQAPVREELRTRR